MCEAFSMASAFTDIGGGIAGSIDAKSRASFEAAQLDSMGVLASAGASNEATALRRSFGEQAGRNMAAIAVSGLAALSFESVAKGNKADLGRNISQIQKNLNVKRQGLDFRAAKAQMEGEMEASASLFNGFIRGANTLTTAEKSYKDNNTGQTRGKYLQDSFASSFFKKG